MPELTENMFRVIGFDVDGCLLCEAFGEMFNCGENLEEYGVENLRPVEMVALGIATR
jgi:hypothetical protein